MRSHVVILAALLLATPVAATAAVLPPHRPLRILLVSDRVNPHNLPPADLTEPGDLPLALRDPAAGLALDPGAEAVHEVPTDEIEEATARLLRPREDPLAYDALVYFAHRIPATGANPQGRQDAFTAAVAAFLATGGGMVSFHHGSYDGNGKAGILDLIGATASGAVPWDTVSGQNVIDTRPGHFVTTSGLSYTGTIAYADPVLGVPAGSYAYFNNVPDERYPQYVRNPTAVDFEVLFGSDYTDNGSAHLLGFVHRRSGDCGRVVGYQPGEYEPNSCDVLGNNFQILANAIVYAAHARSTDGIELHATRAAGDVSLSWNGGAPGFCAFRSLDRARVAGRGSVVASTALRSASDTPPGASVVYYQVTGRD